MIARLRGRLDTKAADHVVVDVGGVGYLAFCSGRTLAELPAAGEAVALFIETHVREDHIHLYGFQEPAERDWFRLLQSVQGVGVKVALALLSVFGPAELTQAVAFGESRLLTRAPGVGGKLASRIVQELKDKVGQLPQGAAVAGGAAAALGGPEADAISALVNLGYRPVDAATAVRAASRANGAGADLQTLVRAGLRELAS
jgi:Holliday junction DNA helicase RuvA